MKLIVALSACILAVSAQPYGLGGLGVVPVLPGVGGAAIGGLPGPLVTGGYGGGSSYGNQGYQQGGEGYHNDGYGTGSAAYGHNIGTSVNDYDSSVHSHQLASHDIGSGMTSSGGAHSLGGYGQYGTGQGAYGSGWNRGVGY